jgi:hypothetical protein
MKDLILSEQQRTTLLMIEEEGQSVALHREGTFSRTVAGGMVKGGVPETFDAVRRYFGGVSRDHRLVVNWKGKDVQADHVLIGMPDDSMAEGDIFTLDGRDYEIVFINNDRRWETKGYVMEHG